MLLFPFSRLSRLRGLCILLSLLLLCSCEKEIITPPALDEVRVERVDPMQDELLQGMIATVTGTSPAGRVQESVFGMIDLDEAIKVTEPGDALTRYSLSVDQQNQLMWTNLILREDAGQVSGYLIEYWPQLDWLMEQQGTIDMRDYEGVIGIKALNGTPLAASYLKNGLSVLGKSYTVGARVMCDETGTGGDGSGGSWGDFGDVGDAGETGSSTTDTGGGEACTWHTSETTGLLVIECPDMGVVGVHLRVQCDDLGDSGSGGGSDGTGDEVSIGTLEPVLLDPLYLEAEAFERKIDTTEVPPCIQSVFDELLNMPEGVGWVLKRFISEDVDYNWVVKYEPTSRSIAVAATSPDYDYETKTIVTRFNPEHHQKATDLAIAKTILHEAVHAFLVSEYFAGQIQYIKSYPELYEDKINGMKEIDAQHEEIVRSFIQDIAHTLGVYGMRKGYPMNGTYYARLAWGGLMDTSFFDGLTETERNKIETIVNAEQHGFDRYGAPTFSKGTRTDCP